MLNHLDIETYSEANLKSEGLFRYAEHESTDLNVVCWAIDNGPVNVWFPWHLSKQMQEITSQLKAWDEWDPRSEVYVNPECPVSLVVALRSHPFAAHNAQFERQVLNGPAGQRYGVPTLSIENSVCTMAKAAVHGIPQALEHAANALGTHSKRKEGVNDMRYLAKPRADGSRPTPVDEPERFLRLTKYCVDDVLAERALDDAIPDLTKAETQVYFLDQRINERGVAVDTASVENAVYVTEQYKRMLAQACLKVTGLKPTQTGKLADWVRENGYPQLKNLQSPTVAAAISDPACPPKARKVLQCYSTHNMKAVTKFDAMLRAVASDGRLHGMFQYYGANPGRWSSRIVQLQNMMRPVIKDCDTAIEALANRSVNWLRFLYDGVDVMKVLASCTRGMLVAGPGKDLLSYDFSQIESRIQAWLADARWKLRIFKEGKVKIYNATGAMMFGLKPAEVVDTGENQLYTAAKIGELACGYQGGEAAIEKFAEQMGVTLTLPADDIKDKWREANREQVKLWYDLEEAARYAVEHSGRAFSIPNGKIAFKVVGRWLYMRLPSGRKLAYLDPVVEQGSVTYMGIDTYTRQWKRVQTYGGKLLQNACEGIGRDLLVNGLMRMEKAGYQTIMTVHDEGVFEVDEGFGSDEEASELMTYPVEWAKGLPVKCDGWRAKRYRK